MGRGADGYLLQAAHRHVLYAARRDGHRARRERPRWLRRAQRYVSGGRGTHRQVVQRRADRDAVRRNVDGVRRHRHLKNTIVGSPARRTEQSSATQTTDNMRVLNHCPGVDFNHVMREWQFGTLKIFNFTSSRQYYNNFIMV